MSLLWHTEEYFASTLGCDYWFHHLCTHKFFEGFLYICTWKCCHNLAFMISASYFPTHVGLCGVLVAFFVCGIFGFFFPSQILQRASHLISGFFFLGILRVFLIGRICLSWSSNRILFFLKLFSKTSKHFTLLSDSFKSFPHMCVCVHLFPMLSITAM